jgi:hypothetical protein
MYVKCKYDTSTGLINSVEVISGSVSTASASGVLYANVTSIPGENLGDFVSNPQHYQIQSGVISLRNGYTQTGERLITTPDMTAPMALLRVNKVGSFATL